MHTAKPAMAAKVSAWAGSLKKINVSFSPTASEPKQVAAVREMLRQLKAPRAGAPDKLVTNVQLNASGADVRVSMQFASGKTVVIPPEGLKMRELRAVVEDHS